MSFLRVWFRGGIYDSCPGCFSLDTKETVDEKGFLRKETTYEELINPNFLPDPDDVGLAFCCR